MFFTYRNACLLAVLMTVFFYIPFDVIGYSTDVWMRLDRIQQWAADGFPFRETLQAAQNYPFGHEMHWTRPLDFIGYALAWTFIPNWGMHEALEIMANFTPLLVLCIAVIGFFYGLRGYLNPLMSFIAFWLFFFGIGYVWGQSTVGYFDHHVFHFAILVWLIALIARYFHSRKKTGLLVGAGLLTALGTWITSEFFINLYIISLPFLLIWLIQGKSLKPVIVYTLTYCVGLTLAMSFDHPMSGFLTLDFYRVSLFHVILGLFNLAVLWGLFVVSRLTKPDLISRFIWLSLLGSIALTCLILGFSDVLLVPMADPYIFTKWLSFVSEMRPTYKTPLVVGTVLLPILLSIGAIIVWFKNKKDKQSLLRIMLAAGLLFYCVMFAFHVRVGISVQAFFIFMASLYFNSVFYPREKGFARTFLFVVFYLAFMGIMNKGNIILTRMQQASVNYLADQVAQNPDYQMPSFLPESYKNAVHRTLESRAKDNTPEPGPTLADRLADQNVAAENEMFSCSLHQRVLDKVRENPVGTVFIDVFNAPEILWKTGQPILAGPYHSNIQGTRAVFDIIWDTVPFDKARSIVDLHQIKQFVMMNPKCLPYIFNNEFVKTDDWQKNNSFYYTVYYEKADIPQWLKLDYYDVKTGVKIFTVR